MSDPVIEATKDLKAWTVTSGKGHAPDLLDRIVKPALESGAQLLVMKSSMVFGLDHLRSALYHAKKAIDEGRNSSDSLTMETLLYASGERQLSTAIKKMSVDAATEEAVVVLLSGPEPEIEDSWKEIDDSRTCNLEERLDKFGISMNEIKTLGDGDPVELVLERVAAVDIIKK